MSRTRPPRFARARSVIVVLVAVVLLALYAVNHRFELGEIYEELHQALPFASQTQAVHDRKWLDDGPMRIDAQEPARMERVDGWSWIAVWTGSAGQHRRCS